MKSMRKLIPALALLLISAIILSSASFAWFTMSRKVTAEGMNVTVTAPNNLLIDKISDSDDWTEAESITKTGVVLVPASTTDATDFYVLKDGTPANSATGARTANSVMVDGTAAVATEDGTAAAGAYYDFKYRVKTEGDTAVPVSLTELTVTNNDTEAPIISIKPVRAAILAGNAANPTTVKGLYNLGAGTHQENSATPAPKAISDVSAADTAGNATLEEVTYKTVNATPANAGDTMFTVNANEIQYVTIRVWFEGEDTECTVAKAAGSNFKVNATFEYNANNATPAP